MAEVSQLAETETSCDVSIAIQNDPTSTEQRTEPHQLHEGMAEVSQLVGTNISYDELSVAIRTASTSIAQKLTLQLPREMLKQKIPRVPPQFLKADKEADTPRVISIGPYHRGKDHLKEMEAQKVQYLNRLLQRTNQSVEIYLSAIRNMVEVAGDCYSDHKLSLADFVEMMVLDGCFIIQLFMGDSFYYRGMINTIWHDLVLVENQLPFFVLCKLLDIIPITFFLSADSTDLKNRFIGRILAAFEGKMPELKVYTTYDDNSIRNVKHLLHLLYSNWRPSQIGTAEKKVELQSDENWEFIPSAAKLRERGIEFRKIKTRGDEKKSLLDINFKKGILEMPEVIVDRHTESMYRSLIVCEQFENTDSAFLTDYILLMDSLINSGEDVELLCKSGIIYNMLGDNESVAALFNRLGAHISLSQPRSLYAQLFKDVKKHYKSDWNLWKTYLRDKYFNTPWAFISFLAASLLLLLTVLQTVFAIFPPS